MSYCKHCKNKEPLYKCPTCGATAHIDKKRKEVIIHAPQLLKPEDMLARARSGNPTPVSVCFPSHADCEISKSVDKIDLKKLVKVK